MCGDMLLLMLCAALVPILFPSFIVASISLMSNKGLSPAEEEVIIRERFLTGASVGRGEPPFKKLIKR